MGDIIKRILEANPWFFQRGWLRKGYYPFDYENGGVDRHDPVVVQILDPLGDRLPLRQISD